MLATIKCKVVRKSPNILGSLELAVDVISLFLEQRVQKQKN